MSFHRRTTVCLTVVAAVLTCATSAGAVTWTALPSGTTATITNVEYQSPARFWFTTSNGDIFTRQGDGSFARTRTGAGVALNDIEFQKGGTTGLAAGNNGLVLRSTNAGASWTPVSGIPVSLNQANTPLFGSASCSGSDPLGNVNAVRFASATRIFLMAEGQQLARSDDGGASWANANRTPSGACRINPSDDTGMGDAFFANATTGWFCNPYFGGVYLTGDGLTGTGTASRQPADCGNGSSFVRRIAGDPSDPARQWAVTPSTSAGSSYTRFTSDAWNSSNGFTVVGGTSDQQAPNAVYDVAYAGGTAVSAGSGGLIMVSRAGALFYSQPASGGQAGADWRAASVADASNAAVGGAGGNLAVTADATSLPVPATAPTPATSPAPTPSTPTPAAPAQPVSASSPKSFSSGGTVITIYRKVTITNRVGRYIPVRAKAKGRRTIRIAIYKKGARRATATKKVVFKRKGIKLVKVTLPATAKVGKYTVVVKIYKGRFRTGKTVRQAIVVA